MGSGDRQASLRDGPLALLGGLTLAVGVGLVLVHPASTPGPLPEGLRTGVVALELARSVSEVEAVIGVDGTDVGRALRDGYRLGTRLDAFFLALYAGFWVRLAWVLRRAGAAGRGVAWFAAVVVMCAALFDVAENLVLLQVLDAPTSEIAGWLPVLGGATWAKWAALGLAAATLAPALWRVGVPLLAGSAGMLLPCVAIGVAWRGAVDVGALGFAVCVFGVTVVAARPPRGAAPRRG